MTVSWVHAVTTNCLLNHSSISAHVGTCKLAAQSVGGFWGADRVHAHRFLDDAGQVGQFVQISVVWPSGHGLLSCGQKPMLHQLSSNLLLYLQRRIMISTSG